MHPVMSAARFNVEAPEGLATYQDPIPNSAAVDAITLGPDGDGHSPGDEDDQGLCKMNQVLGPPQVTTGGPGDPELGHGLKKRSC